MEGQTIKQYLEQVRAAGGVPTFTNIGGENPAIQPGPMPPAERQADGMRQAPPAAHLIKEENQPVMDAGGMVSRPQPAKPARAPVDRTDPYAMANRAVENQFDELFKSQFPNREPGDGLSKPERDMFDKVVQSHRNAYVDRFKYQLDQGKATEKEDYTRKQAETKRSDLSEKERRAAIQKLLERYDKDNLMDPSMEGKDAITWANEQMARQDAAMSKGPAIDPQAAPAQGQPADQGNPALGGGVDPSREDPMAAPEGQSIEDYTPTPQEMQSFIKSLRLQYGASDWGRQKAKEAMMRRFPKIALK